MLKIVLIVVAAAAALLLAYAATRPDTFRVARSARIDAPPQRIFALINDLHAFNRWNPYERKDPALKGRYGQTGSGPGAVYAWESAKVGTGQMEIVDTAAPSRIAMKLDFIKPFEAHNLVEFTLTPADGATDVTWAMHGSQPFVAKVMNVVFNMDRMVGKDFEDGLGNLKTLAEAR
jgi:uncharacterized protein YndB with AHSA1/START domain